MMESWEFKRKRENRIWRYSYAVSGLATVALFLTSDFWFPTSLFDPSNLTSQIEIAKASRNTEIGKFFGGDEYTVMKPSVSVLLAFLTFVAFHKLRGNRKFLCWLEARRERDRG